MSHPAPAANAPRPPVVKDTAIVRVLLLVSVALWIASLGLPGYYLAGPTSTPVTGTETLLAGLLAGWAAWCLAAYANLPWLWSVAALFAGARANRALVVMMVLMLTMTLFTAQPNPGAPSNAVHAWGLGALAWVVALALTAIAGAIRASRDAGKERNVSILLASGVIVVVSVVSLMTHPVWWPRSLELRFNGPATPAH